jgi:hypothetical protein
MENKEIILSQAQYKILSDARGLHEKAHSLVMTAKLTSDKKWILNGDEDAFDKLVSDLFDEIEIQPRSKSERIARLIYKLDPECEF